MSKNNILPRAKRVAIEAVKKSGFKLAANFKRQKDMRFKARNDIVTKMDMVSERILVDAIKKNFPDHSILTEEHSKELRNSEYSWIIDPIDGTINYFHGTSPFRVGLCLLKNNKPLLSVIYNPIKKDLYFAEKGQGAFLGSRRIHVSRNKDLKKTIVMTHISSQIDSRARTLMALGSIFRNVLHIRALGSGMASATYIAEGKYDVFFNIDTNPWDILPAALLISEAGGRATDIAGRELNIDSTSILATNNRFHTKMLKLLKNV